MKTGLLHLHSTLRWVILVLLVLTIVQLFTNKAARQAKILTIVSHVMLLIGVIQWFITDWGLKLIQNVGMASVMKDKIQRFFAVEHALTMIIAIVLITMGGVAVRKENTKKARILYVVALLLILSRIPWPFMAAGAGRGWF
ncbi:MAG: hypothetical protein NBV77_06995 [Bacteroidia bacterium]|jgi:hypothetical protein|nr:hypothetical protein [Bacteroidia bacterium]